MLLTYPANILVENLCQGARGSYRISWKPSPLATGYNVYRSRIPYGIADRIADNITDTSYTDDGFDIIDGTECYYRVSCVRNTDGTPRESGLSRFQTSPDTTEYMNPYEGTWTDANTTRYDPHDNLYPNGDSSYIGVNYLPLNVLRRYQFNKILRDELWILQDRGEPVYLIKKQRTNYSAEDEESEERLKGRSNAVRYYPPIVIGASIASPGQTHVVSVRGAALERNTHCWTIYTPKLIDGDIIITRDNGRYEIQNVTYQRSWRGAVTWQSFDIRALAVTDPVFSHPQLRNVDGTKLYIKKHFWQGTI